MYRSGAETGNAKDRRSGRQLPLRTVIADVVGIGGGGIVATSLFGLSMSQFLIQFVMALAPDDIIGGVIKPISFALIIGSIACYKG